MGIPGLWNELSAVGETVNLADLCHEAFRSRERAGRAEGGTGALRLGIDASIMMFTASKAIWNPTGATVASTPQTTPGNAANHQALLTLFHRLGRFLSLPVLPLFVYDGPCRPRVKRDRIIWQDSASPLQRDFADMCKAFGFAVHVAPGEAEAELAFLEQAGVLDAVMTDDADALVFGTGTLLSNWGSMGGIMKGQATREQSASSSASAASSEHEQDAELPIPVASGSVYDPAEDSDPLDSDDSRKRNRTTRRGRGRGEGMGRSGTGRGGVPSSASIGTNDTILFDADPPKTPSKVKSSQAKFSYDVVRFRATDIASHPDGIIDQDTLVLAAILGGADYSRGAMRFGPKISIALGRAGFASKLVSNFKRHCQPPSAPVMQIPVSSQTHGLIYPKVVSQPSEVIASEGWAPFLANWKAQVAAELESNSRGFMSRKAKKLASSPALSNFLSTTEALRVMSNYVWPLTSAVLATPAAIAAHDRIPRPWTAPRTIAAESLQYTPPDVLKIVHFKRHTLGYAPIKAVQRIKSLLEHGLVLRLLLHAAQTSSRSAYGPAPSISATPRKDKGKAKAKAKASQDDDSLDFFDSPNATRLSSKLFSASLSSPIKDKTMAASTPSVGSSNGAYLPVADTVEDEAEALPSYNVRFLAVTKCGVSPAMGSEQHHRLQIDTSSLMRRLFDAAVEVPAARARSRSNSASEKDELEDDVVGGEQETELQRILETRTRHWLPSAMLRVHPQAAKAVEEFDATVRQKEATRLEKEMKAQASAKAMRKQPKISSFFGAATTKKKKEGVERAVAVKPTPQRTLHLPEKTPVRHTGSAEPLRGPGQSSKSHASSGASASPIDVDAFLSDNEETPRVGQPTYSSSDPIHRQRTPSPTPAPSESLQHPLPELYSQKRERSTTRSSAESSDSDRDGPVQPHFSEAGLSRPSVTETEESELEDWDDSDNLPSVAALLRSVRRSPSKKEQRQEAHLQDSKANSRSLSWSPSTPQLPCSPPAATSTRADNYKASPSKSPRKSEKQRAAWSLRAGASSSAFGGRATSSRVFDAGEQGDGNGGEEDQDDDEVDMDPDASQASVQFISMSTPSKAISRDNNVEPSSSRRLAGRKSNASKEAITIDSD